MGISSSGLISGINSDQLISQLMELERAPIKTIQKKQQDYQFKIASFSDISTKISSFKAALDALNSSSKFNVKNASVTKTSDGDDLLSVSASSSAMAGSYSMQVKQLASAATKASQGWVDQNTTAIASSGGTFEFKVGSGGATTTIGVSSTMTLQGLRDAINSASGTGATASIINDGSGSNPYRLILTANSTGSSNSIFITTNTTSLDLSNKKIEDVYANTTNSYAGSVYSNSGNYYTGTDNKSFIAKITTAGAPGTAKYKYSTDGGIIWSSEITTKTNDGASDIEINATNKTIYVGGLPVNIAEGFYSGTTLAAALETALGAADYDVAYASATRKFTITKVTAGDVTLNWSNSGATAAAVLIAVILMQACSLTMAKFQVQPQARLMPG